MNTTYTGSASITIEGSSSLKVGDIYASGADEPEYDRDNWFDITEPPAPEVQPVLYPVNGEVNIRVNNQSINQIDGKGADTANVSIGTEYPIDYIKLYDISKLTVERV